MKRAAPVPVPVPEKPAGSHSRRQALRALGASAATGCVLLASPLRGSSAAAAGPALAVLTEDELPPPEPREFRAAWVATVANIDWPSAPGLPVEQQRREALSLLNHAQATGLNALVFQVRPAGDALYPSTLEPWSEFLTGAQGRAPEPAWDPLAFWVREAHQRGLELHAWFNPYRARPSPAKSPLAAPHLGVLRPELVKRYGDLLWMDPGEPDAAAHTLAVVADVVRRYDIDGVHLDDYFYPYQEKDASGKYVDFPDWPSWRKYVATGGKLPRHDWRRENVNGFIQRLYNSIKAEKRHVKFGISPFGIWRPGHPESIKGLDAFDRLYADSRKWLAQGWLDYVSPQLYWSIAAKEQSYPVLLKWWSEQNPQQRHLWPGDAVSRIGPARAADEIVNQIQLTRKQAGASGNLHWSFKALLHNRGGITDALLKETYRQPALVPASSWLGKSPTNSVKFFVRKGAMNSGLKMSWENAGREKTWLWTLQMKVGPDWTTEIFPGHQTSHQLGRKESPQIIVLTAIDRCGNAGAPVVLERSAAP